MFSGHLGLTPLSLQSGVLSVLTQRPQNADREGARCAVASNTVYVQFTRCAIAYNAMQRQLFEHKMYYYKVIILYENEFFTIFANMCCSKFRKKQVKNLKRYEHCASAVCALCARRQRAVSTRPHSANRFLNNVQTLWHRRLV